MSRVRTEVPRCQPTCAAGDALVRRSDGYMASGIVGEAQTAAAVLGHIFPDSGWYKRAYNLVRSGGLEPSENQGSYIARAFKKLDLG